MRLSLVHHVSYSLTGLHDLPIFLAEKGHDVSDICWSGSKKWIVDRQNSNLTHYLMPGVSFSLPGFVSQYPYIPNLSKAIRLLSPNIVHAQSHLFLPTVEAVKAASKLGIPSVVTVHGVSVDRSILSNSAQQIYLRTLGLDVFRSADRIVCLTRYDAERVAKIGCPNEKIRTVPNAVNTKRFMPSDKDERRDALVVWTGRFVPEKGLPYLVEAAKLVVEKRKNVRFLLVGYGPLKTKIKKLAYDYGLLDRFLNIIGPVGRDKIPSILGKASIFAFPSLSEGQPISVLEAMACGLPVVCSDIPGLREVVRHRINGLVVPARNSPALSNALLTLLSDEDLRKTMGQNSRRLALSKYSWQVVVNQLEKVYSELV